MVLIAAHSREAPDIAEATRQLWNPEWIITGWGNQDTAIGSKLADQRQWAHAFGVGTLFDAGR